MTKPIIKVGDTVLFNAPGDAPDGKTGVVVHKDSADSYVVEFVRFDGGHDGHLSDGANNRWYVTRSELTKVAPKKVAAPKKPTQEYRGNGKHAWEDVTDGTERLRVPGGWLYNNGYDMAFVPMPEVVKHKV